MTLEHHRDLAHEFPELKQRVHDLKTESAEFRRLYAEYEKLDNEVHRIEQEIETPSDAYTETLKHRRAHLKDRLYGLLTGRIHPAPDTEEYVVRHKFREPVDHGEVSRAWSEQGFDCVTCTDAPAQDWRAVSEGRDEVLVVIEGGLEVEMHGVRYALRPGDEMFIPREAPYRMRNASGQQTRWFHGRD
jgi:hypothetical protein